jgi:hypothetical protein
MSFRHYAIDYAMMLLLRALIASHFLSLPLISLRH